MDSIWIMSPNGTVAEGTGFTMAKCMDGCPDAGDSMWMYSDSVKGGFLRSKASVNGVEQANLVLAPAGNQFGEGTEVTYGKCGDDPNVPATLDSCDFKEAQWELLPMFAIEEGIMGRARTVLLAGFALKTHGSLVRGFTPLRAGRAGFFFSFRFNAPASLKEPFFFPM